jgi:hypothetical protein
MATTFGIGNTTGSAAKLSSSAPLVPHVLTVVCSSGGTIYPTGRAKGGDIVCAANAAVTLNLISNLRVTEYLITAGTCSYWADPA